MAAAPTFEILPLTVPLQRWDDGSVRVGGTRVRLETIVTAYLSGAAPEAISDSYGKLPLHVVYGTIAYYLQHRERVDAYLERERAAGDEWWEAWEREHPESAELRERIEATASAEVDARRTG